MNQINRMKWNRNRRNMSFCKTNNVYDILLFETFYNIEIVLVQHVSQCKKEDMNECTK